MSNFGDQQQGVVIPGSLEALERKPFLADAAEQMTHAYVDLQQARANYDTAKTFTANVATEHFITEKDGKSDSVRGSLSALALTMFGFDTDFSGSDYEELSPDDQALYDRFYELYVGFNGGSGHRRPLPIARVGSVDGQEMQGGDVMEQITEIGVLPGRSLYSRDLTYSLSNRARRIFEEIDHEEYDNERNRWRWQHGYEGVLELNPVDVIEYDKNGDPSAPHDKSIVIARIRRPKSRLATMQDIESFESEYAIGLKDITAVRELRGGDERFSGKSANLTEDIRFLERVKTLGEMTASEKYT